MSEVGFGCKGWWMIKEWCDLGGHKHADVAVIEMKLMSESY